MTPSIGTDRRASGRGRRSARAATRWSATGPPRIRAFPRSVLVADPDVVAPKLLGALLVVRHDEADLRIGRILEVEAYGGADDPASHAWRGRSARNASMFGPPGTCYVYRSYGLHWCVNVVTGTDGPAAVLVRAVEPVAGLDAMRRARGVRRDIDVADGPGKLASALGIDGSHDGRDLLDPASPLQLCRAGVIEPFEIRSSARVGISRATGRRWRWWIAGHPGVSMGRPGDRTGRRAS